MKSAWKLKAHCIDLIIYDSSSDDKTEALVKNYTIDGCDTVKYARYDGIFDGFSIDHKVIKAYEDYANQYEYIWVCRDGFIIDIDSFYNKLVEITQNKPDLICVDASFRNNNEKIIKEYDDCLDFFKDNVYRMIIE